MCSSDLKGFVEISDSFLGFALHLAYHATQFVCICDERIALDCNADICLGATHIVEVVFGESPVEVGLGEIRLGRYDLIEILDRKHVVLEVKRVAPDIEDLIGIDLRCRRKGGAKE